MRRALWITFVLSACGALFSGTLTYREIFGASALACPSPGAAGTILGYPACVYGFGMFVVLTLVSGWGLWTSRGGIRAAPLAATRLR